MNLAAHEYSCGETIRFNFNQMLSLDFEQTVHHLLQQLKSDEPRWMIALAGMAGSGKSTLAARLSRAVNAAQPNSMIALGMDGFHLTKAQLRQMPDAEAAFARRGAPWTFDVEAFAQRLNLVREAANREAVAWPDFQHEIGDPIEAAHFVQPETRLVLVEGSYLLHRENGWARVGECFDERFYLDVPLDVAMKRLTMRHMKAWNMTREQAQNRIDANDRLNAEIAWRDRDSDWRDGDSDWRFVEN